MYNILFCKPKIKIFLTRLWFFGRLSFTMCSFLGFSLRAKILNSSSNLYFWNDFRGTNYIQRHLTCLLSFFFLLGGNYNSIRWTLKRQTQEEKKTTRVELEQFQEAATSNASCRLLFLNPLPRLIFFALNCCESCCTVVPKRKKGEGKATLFCLEK